MSEPSELATGTIRAWSDGDSVGRIELDSGEWVRFGGTSVRFVPAVGLRVEARDLEHHPLGGRRARAVVLVDAADARSVLDQQRPLVGTQDDEAGQAAFAEMVNGVGLLGILLHEPLTSRAALHAWFARAGIAVDFGHPDAPVVRAGDEAYRVFICARELPAGRGFVSFAPAAGPMSIEVERELALASAETGGPRVERLAQLASLVQLVARCAANEAAVTAHQSINHFVAPGAAWHTLAPLDQWTSIIRHQHGHILLSGMRSLYLPDLWGSADVEPDIVQAAVALVALGRRPEIGYLLGPCVVVESDNAWVHVEPGMRSP